MNRPAMLSTRKPMIRKIAAATIGKTTGRWLCADIQTLGELGADWFQYL